METLDLRADYERIYGFLKGRIEGYGASRNDGPGASEDPISLITFGYDFVHLGWVALIFDTRPGAEVDGEWVVHISGREDIDREGGTTISMPHWNRILGVDYDEEIDPDDDAPGGYQPLRVTLRDGSLLELIDYGDEDLSILGDLMRDALLQARAEGLLERLPLAETCSLSVENFDGCYDWPDPDEVRSEGNAKSR